MCGGGMTANSITAGGDIGELFRGSDVCAEADSAMGLSGKEGLPFPAESSMCEDQGPLGGTEIPSVGRERST